MNDFITIIQTLGFPIACVVGLGIAYYKQVNRDKDEAKDREDRLIDANVKNSEALNKVADTIVNSDKINKELSETNKMLVDGFKDKLTDIDNKVDILLDRQA